MTATNTDRAICCISDITDAAAGPEFQNGNSSWGSSEQSKSNSSSVNLVVLLLEIPGHINMLKWNTDLGSGHRYRLFADFASSETLDTARPRTGPGRALQGL